MALCIFFAFWLKAAVPTESGFPCLNCGANTQIFYASMTGERLGWSCPNCKMRGFFKGEVPGRKVMASQEL